MTIAIGVSGITNPTQSQEVIDIFKESAHKTPNNFILRFGILTSAKVINREPIGSKWRPRYPDLETIKVILEANKHNPLIEYFIHYSTDKEHLDSLKEHLKELARLAGTQLTGFQINCSDWLDPKELITLNDLKSQGLQIILQISAGLLRSITAPINLINLLKPLRKSISEILIDPSSGQGKLLNTELTRILLWTINDGLPWLKIGVAGGLSGETLKEVLPTLKPFTPNIDAEGGLRSNNVLSIPKVSAYLKSALSLYS